MVFVNLTLLIGGLLAGIPIVLHLVMRQQPRHLVFPAIRFVHQRRQSNQRRLRLRHWMLLLLRCLAIAALAAGLARPSVGSADVGNWLVVGALLAVLLVVGVLFALSIVESLSRWIVSGLGGLTVLLVIALIVMVLGAAGFDGGRQIGNQQAPVAAVMVFDTSPRMTLRHQNQSRIEASQELARWLVAQLPNDSDVAVIDSRASVAAFAVDRRAALKGVAALQIATSAPPIGEAIRAALDLTQTSDQDRKELYIFTDQTEQAWSGSGAASLATRLEQLPDVQVYVVDVGVESPLNFALGDVRLSAQALPPGGQLQIQTELTHVGPGGERVVELYLQQPDAEPPVLVDGTLEGPDFRLADRTQIELPENGAEIIEFRPGGLELGTHHGWLQVVGQDGLEIDDRRHFTFAVKEAWPILVAHGPGASPQMFVEALAPLEFRETGQARFECKVVATDLLAAQELDAYAAVCLLDPPPLDLATWELLRDYVSGGGGLAICLGRNAVPIDQFNEVVKVNLLPGSLVRQWRTTGQDVYLDPRSGEHMLLARFRSIGTTVPWHAFPVLRHWQLDELAEDAVVVLGYGNGQPAMIEWPVGQGTVLTMTTPLSDPGNLEGRLPWNLLPIGREPWPFLILANEMMVYLAASGQTRLNYLAGETATLNKLSTAESDRYLVLTPQGSWEDVLAARNQISVRFTDSVGVYRLVTEDKAPTTGFSVNIPLTASDLQRLPVEQLDERLGVGRYRIARNREQIVRDQGESRVGREIYPLLMLVLALVLGLEHLLANRFYGKEAGARATAKDSMREAGNLSG